MASITLLTLRTAARERANMENSTFIADAELTRYINASAQELYDLLVEANQDYAVTSATFSIASGANTTSLAAGFYKLRGVDKNLNGTWVPVRSYDYLERGRYQDVSVSRLASDVVYRILNDTLEFLPTDHAPGDYRYRYVPAMTVMSGDSDTFNGYNGFEEYIIVDAAIKMKDKEESSTTVLREQKKGLMERIQAMGNIRDYGDAGRVADIRSADTYLTVL